VDSCRRIQASEDRLILRARALKWRNFIFSNTRPIVISICYVNTCHHLSFTFQEDEKANFSVINSPPDILYYKGENFYIIVNPFFMILTPFLKSLAFSLLQLS